MTFLSLARASRRFGQAELTWFSRRVRRVANVRNSHDPLQVCLELPSDRSTPAAILSRHPLVTNSLPRARRTQVLGRGAAESTRPIKESVHISTSALLQLVEAAGARIRRRFSHAVSTHVSFKCVRQNLISCCAWSWAEMLTSVSPFMLYECLGGLGGSRGGVMGDWVRRTSKAALSRISLVPRPNEMS